VPFTIEAALDLVAPVLFLHVFLAYPWPGGQAVEVS
jgi:hypothetical protein